VYFTDKGIEELAERRGAETVSLEWLAGRLRDYVHLHPGTTFFHDPGGRSPTLSFSRRLDHRRGGGRQRGALVGLGRVAVGPGGVGPGGGSGPG